METGAKTYEIRHDQADSFANLQIENPKERRIAQEQFSSYLMSQMETTLGERFNVELSRFSYDIKDGQLWGKDMDEPFSDSIKRGRDYRKIHGKAIDWAREDAEVVGFEKMQKELLSGDAKIGDAMISISIRGAKNSTYQHNFWDSLELKVNEIGERYVEARRHASTLGPQDYKEKLGIFGSVEDFLSNPIKLPRGITVDAISAYLQEGQEFMQDDEFAVIKNECRGVISAYVRAIVEEPGNDVLHRILFNTIINKADDVAERLKEGGYTHEMPGLITIQQEVERYGFQPVKEIETGCGTLGGYDVRITSPFGVAEYASDIWGERTFKCPTCNAENIRPVNQRIPFCQHCGSDEVMCKE